MAAFGRGPASRGRHDACAVRAADTWAVGRVWDCEWDASHLRSTSGAAARPSRSDPPGAAACPMPPPGARQVAQPPQASERQLAAGPLPDFLRRYGGGHMRG